MTIKTSLLILLLIFASCGKPLKYNNKLYPTYGLLNHHTKKSNKMCYEISFGNIVWSILLIQTIIAPVYFIGFSLYNPVQPISENGGCGIDN